MGAPPLNPHWTGPDGSMTGPDGSWTGTDGSWTGHIWIVDRSQMNAHALKPNHYIFFLFQGGKGGLVLGEKHCPKKKVVLIQWKLHLLFLMLLFLMLLFLMNQRTASVRR